MTLEETRLWFAGLSRPRVKRLLARLLGRENAPTPSRVRPGDFICDEHWSEIVESWVGPDPIDASAVTIGLSIACWMASFPPEPVHHACCELNRAGWQGILERARPSWQTRSAKRISA